MFSYYLKKKSNPVCLEVRTRVQSGARGPARHTTTMEVRKFSALRTQLGANRQCGFEMFVEEVPGKILPTSLLVRHDEQNIGGARGGGSMV